MSSCSPPVTHHLTFVVLDSEKPAQWRPWSQEDKRFGKIAEECRKRVWPDPPGTVGKYHLLKLTPSLIGLGQIEADENKHLIVGAMVDATTPYSVTEFYERKLSDLEELTYALNTGRQQSRRLMDKIGYFQIWFLTEPAIKKTIEGWTIKAASRVEQLLQRKVIIKFVYDTAIFDLHTDEYFINAMDALTARGNP